MKVADPSIYTIITYLSNNVQQSYCQMLAKTKTANLIMQKQLQKQKQYCQPNTISQPLIDSNKTLPRQEQNINRKKLAARHLGQYDVFSQTFKGQNKLKPQPSTQNNLSLSDQYCQLQRQNYRLIQANFNMLKKFASIMDTMRKQLMRVVQYIQQYHYVQSIKTIYGLLDLIRKIDHTNTKIVSDSVRFNGLDNIKRNLSNNLSNDRNQDQIQQRQFLQTGSVVYEYNYKIQKTQINPAKPRKPLQTCLREFQIAIKPQQQQKLSIQCGFQALQTPYFSEGRSFKPKSHMNLSHEKLLNSFQYPGIHSRVQSAKDYGINRKIAQSFQDQIQQKTQKQPQPRFRNGAYSQNNIKVFKNNKKKAGLEEDKPDQLYRHLFIQAITIQHFILQE